MAGEWFASGFVLAVALPRAAGGFKRIQMRATCADQATAVLECERLAITLPLLHFRHLNLLTNCATGASGLTPNRTSSRSEIAPRCPHLKQRTKMIASRPFAALLIAVI
jgi:hypothetical protein